jgi:hypothetical protein
MHIAPYDVRITLKGDDNKLVQEFKACDYEVALHDDCESIKRLVDEAKLKYAGEPDEVVITFRYQWK